MRRSGLSTECCGLLRTIRELLRTIRVPEMKTQRFSVSCPVSVHNVMGNYTLMPATISLKHFFFFFFHLLKCLGESYFYEFRGSWAEMWLAFILKVITIVTDNVINIE